MSWRDLLSPSAALLPPSPDELLEGVFTLGREVHLEMDEATLLRRFLDTLTALFPARAFSIRVVDMRSRQDAFCVVRAGELRPGVASAPITLKSSSVEKTQLRQDLIDCDRLRLGEIWDSPFVGLDEGFAVPLVASGDCYGVLDVGYAAGQAAIESDEPLILPIANQLSVALRNERLHRESTMLREHLEQLVEYANALILGVDRRGRVTVFNRALCRLLGYRRDEVIGCDLRSLLYGDELPALRRMFFRALSGHATDSVEVTLIAKDRRRTRTVWSIAAASVDDDGRDVVVAVGQDQTRILELQRQVVQAEKLATLGQLAAGVVHELNNPLTSITVYAEYLRAKLARHLERAEPLAVDRGDVEKLARVGASAARIAQFSQELVQYAKPARSAPEPVSVRDVVAQSLSFCKHLFEGERIAVAQAVARELPPVMAVRGQLEQVLINLIINAVHAIDGAGTIDIRAEPEGRERVLLSVGDSGPGVARADRERVFEPFFSTKTEGRGTGLGLSIVQGIVERHQGTIEIGTSAAGGALFVVRLPCHQSSLAPLRDEAAGADPDAGAEGRTGEPTRAGYRDAADADVGV